jgi:hypothetical protein
MGVGRRCQSSQSVGRSIFVYLEVFRLYIFSLFSYIFTKNYKIQKHSVSKNIIIIMIIIIILMHLLGKSHGAVKNDIQNKINHLLRSGKRRRDTRDNDNIPPILGEDA